MKAQGGSAVARRAPALPAVAAAPGAPALRRSAPPPRGEATALISAAAASGQASGAASVVAGAFVGAAVALGGLRQGPRRLRGPNKGAAVCGVATRGNAPAGRSGGRGEEPLDLGLGAELVVNPPHDAGKVGVLLLNIGTPASTSVADVRAYLEQFLSDDRVIELQPPLLKWVVLQALLLSRPQASATNYQRIWDPVRGSPLLFHSEDLAAGLQKELGDQFQVGIGMQYSEPTVVGTLKQLASSGVDNVVLVPMFPHYASGTTGSCLSSAYRTAAELYCTPFLSVLPPFYGHPSYVSAMRQSIAEVVGHRGADVDHLLFSFHGLPEEQCSRTDETGNFCNRGPDCCAKLRRANRNCYRAQCFETARLLAFELGLPEDKWSIGFQSRLTLRGTVQWIRPYTDEAFQDLAHKGVKRLAIVAPSFTADCIETLEELGITGRKEFADAGGEELVLVPCLNSSQVWVRGLAQMVREHVIGRTQLEHAAAAAAAISIAVPEEVPERSEAEGPATPEAEPTAQELDSQTAAPAAKPRSIRERLLHALNAWQS